MTIFPICLFIWKDEIRVDNNVSVHLVSPNEGGFNPISTKNLVFRRIDTHRSKVRVYIYGMHPCELAKSDLVVGFVAIFSGLDAITQMKESNI